MARVPRITAPTVANAPVAFVPQQKVSDTRAFGTGGGGLAAVSRAASDVNVVLAGFEADENDRLAKDADIAWKQARRAILHGDGKTPGYYGRVGADGVDDYLPSRELMTSERDRISSEMTSSGARKIFDSSSKLSIEGDFDRMTTHLNTNRKSAQITTSNARMVEAGEDASIALGDPVVTSQSLGIVRAEIFSQQHLQGWSEETLNSELEKATTLLYGTMIDYAIKIGETKRAVDMLAQFTGQMDPAVVADYTKTLEKPKFIAESQVEVATRLAEGEEAGMSDKEIVEKARKDLAKQPQLLDVTVDELLKQIDRKNRFDTAEVKAAFGSVIGDISTGETDLNEYIKTNPDMYDRIVSVPGNFETLRLAEKRKIESDGFAPASDGKTFTDLILMPEREFADVNLETKKPHLTSNEYNEVVKKQAATQKALSKDAAKSKPFTDARKQLRARTPAWNWGSNRKKNKEKTDLTEPVRKELDDFIQGGIDAGKPHSFTDIEKEITRLLLEVEDPTIFNPFAKNFFLSFDTIAGKRSELTRAERDAAVVTADNIPPDLKAALTTAIKSNKLKVTDDLLENLAGAEAMGDVFRMRRLLGIDKSVVIPGGVSVPLPGPDVVSLPGEVQAAVRQREIEQGTADEGGDRPVSYVDTEGHLTGGIGHKLTSAEKGKYPEGTEIPQSVRSAWFEKDQVKAEEAAISLLPEGAPLEVVAIIGNMAFNLGKTGLSKFKNMFAAIEAKDYETAADEMVNSKWFKQVGNRSKRLVARMRAVGVSTSEDTGFNFESTDGSTEETVNGISIPRRKPVPPKEIAARLKKVQEQIGDDEFTAAYGDLLESDHLARLGWEPSKMVFISENQVAQTNLRGFTTIKGFDAEAVKRGAEVSGKAVAEYITETRPELIGERVVVILPSAVAKDTERTVLHESRHKGVAKILESVDDETLKDFRVSFTRTLSTVLNSRGGAEFIVGQLDLYMRILAIIKGETDENLQSIFEDRQGSPEEQLNRVKRANPDDINNAVKLLISQGFLDDKKSK